VWVRLVVVLGCVVTVVVVVAVIVLKIAMEVVIMSPVRPGRDTRAG
jgi:hypothetical protein